MMLPLTRPLPAELGSGRCNAVGGVVVGRLTAADAWYLYLEGPTVRMHVTALLLLDPSNAPGGFSFAKLRNFVSGRLDVMPALRRRLVEVPFSIDHPSWIEDPDFDLDRRTGGTSGPGETGTGCCREGRATG